MYTNTSMINLNLITFSSSNVDLRSSYNNKILSYLINTFSEMILKYNSKTSTYDF